MMIEIRIVFIKKEVLSQIYLIIIGVVYKKYYMLVIWGIFKIKWFFRIYYMKFLIYI